MPACDGCRQIILFGGVKDGGMLYCNARCRDSDGLAPLANQVPAHMVEKAMLLAACARCGRQDAVSVYTSHRVWSFVMSSCSSRRQICCQGCARKMLLGDTAVSLALGRWGHHGLIVTPFEVLSNLRSLVFPRDEATCRAHLEQEVRRLIAKQLLAARSETPAGQAGTD